MRELKVGCRYMTAGGYFIRTITAIRGDYVDYMDQSGTGCCTRRTFIKRCLHVVIDSDPPASAMVEAGPKIDRAITNKVLEHVITLQNQLDTWFKVLDQAMEYYDPVLTPAQRDAHESLSKEAANLAKHLQRHREFLMQ